MAKQRFTQDQVIAALQQGKGMLSVAARILQCDRTTVSNYCERYPRVAAVRSDEREATIDIGEIALMRAVQEGEPWAVQFMLRTVGKNRGYAERWETTGANGGPIEIDDVNKLTDSERAQRVENLLSLARARAARGMRGAGDGQEDGGHVIDVPPRPVERPAMPAPAEAVSV